MQAISTKELRNELPSIRRRLKMGEEFLLIHQSQPIAKLSPVKRLADWEDASDKEIETASVNDFNDESLSKDELKYYLSLK